MPDAMELIFQSALALGRCGAVSILLFSYFFSCVCLFVYLIISGITSTCYFVRIPMSNQFHE